LSTLSDILSEVIFSVLCPGKVVKGEANNDVINLSPGTASPGASETVGDNFIKENGVPAKDESAPGQHDVIGGELLPRTTADDIEVIFEECAANSSGSDVE